MTQAGLHKITLYENKEVLINFDTFDIITQGQQIELNDFPKLIIDPQSVNINYKISAQLDNFDQELVNNINDSVYGWIALFEFLDLEKKIVEKPFFRLVNSDLDTNIANVRTINLESWNRQGLIAFS